MAERKSKIQEALEKFDEKTQEKLAEKILSFADETSMSSTQKNCIRFLKVLCPIALIFCAPVVTYFYTLLQSNTNPLVFWLSLIPLMFIAIITTIVDVILKTPE